MDITTDMDKDMDMGTDKDTDMDKDMDTNIHRDMDIDRFLPWQNLSDQCCYILL
jgi:hypothetical protein